MQVRVWDWKQGKCGSVKVTERLGRNTDCMFYRNIPVSFIMSCSGISEPAYLEKWVPTSALPCKLAPREFIC